MDQAEALEGVPEVDQAEALEEVPEVDQAEVPEEIPEVDQAEVPEEIPEVDQAEVPVADLEEVPALVLGDRQVVLEAIMGQQVQPVLPVQLEIIQADFQSHPQVHQVRVTI